MWVAVYCKHTRAGSSLDVYQLVEKLANCNIAIPRKAPATWKNFVNELKETKRKGLCTTRFHGSETLEKGALMPWKPLPLTSLQPILWIATGSVAAHWSHLASLIDRYRPGSGLRPSYSLWASEKTPSSVLTKCPQKEKEITQIPGTAVTDWGAQTWVLWKPSVFWSSDSSLQPPHVGFDRSTIACHVYWHHICLFVYLF